MTAIPKPAHPTVAKNPFADFVEDPVPPSRRIDRAPEQRLPRAAKPKHHPACQECRFGKQTEFTAMPPAQSLFVGVTYQSAVEFFDPYGDDDLEARLREFRRMYCGL